MNTRGLLTLKKEKVTHLNWVQPDNGHADHTQSNYIENKVKPSRQINHSTFLLNKPSLELLIRKVHESFAKVLLQGY